MADLDSLAVNFTRAKERWPNAPTLAQYHKALSACFLANDHGLVEHVKSFIESVCITILGEFRQPMPSNQPSTTELLVAALRPLGLQNTRGASKLDKVLSAFNKLTDALSEMRNDLGPVAHGKDAFLDAISADHARTFLHAGDAILGILLNAFDGKEPNLEVTREPYTSFPTYNDLIDQAVSVQAATEEDEGKSTIVLSFAVGRPDEAMQIRIEPSRLLYGIDRSAYVEMLEEAKSIKIMPEEIQPDDATVKIVEKFQFPSFKLVPEVTSTYNGRLAPLRPKLNVFLLSEGLDTSATISDGAHIVDSLLATVDENMGVDWRTRATLQSRLKVSSKRVFLRFGQKTEQAEHLSKRLLDWLSVHVPDDEVLSDAGAK
jgi:hypothetical protein